MKASRNAEKLARLRSRCLDDFQMEFGRTNGQVLLCPLCWKEKPLSEFSLEHVVPESLGGTVCTVSCTPCNNDLGSEIDSHVGRFLLERDACNGLADIPAEVMTSEGRMSANVRFNFTGGPNEVRIVERATNRSVMDETKAKMDSIESFQLRWSFRYSQDGMQRGLMKMAYLAMFEQFGYGYVRQMAPQAIRRRIMGDWIEHPDLSSLVWQVKSCSEPSSYRVVGFRWSGATIYSVLVQLNAVTTHCRSLLMPGFGTSPSRFFRHFRELTRSSVSMTVRERRK